MATKNGSLQPLLVVGSIAFDSVKTPLGTAKKVIGGSSVYFSSAARFFASVKMIGVVGTDFPQSHLDDLKKLGIDTSGIVTHRGKTFHWKGFYEGDMNQAHTLKTDLNVFAQFRPVLSASDRNHEHVFLANIDPNLQMSVLKQVAKPRWIACDTMNYWIESQKSALLDVLKHVDISFMNDAEIRQLSGHSNLLRAARWVMKLGPSIVIVKKGEHGVLCVWKNRVFLFPAYLLEDVIDPTGAGDSFAGGFLGYLSRHKNAGEKEIKNALAHGAIVASFNVQSFGNERLAKLSQEEITSRYGFYKKMISLV